MLLRRELEPAAEFGRLMGSEVESGGLLGCKDSGISVPTLYGLHFIIPGIALLLKSTEMLLKG